MSQTTLTGSVPGGLGGPVRAGFNAVDHAIASKYAGADFPTVIIPNQDFYHTGLEADFVANPQASAWLAARWRNKTAAPTQSDDTNSRNTVGTLWLVPQTNKAYLCLNAASSAAVWLDLTAPVTWGQVSGAIGNQTDLSTVLDGKLNNTSFTGAAIANLLDAHLGGTSWRSGGSGGAVPAGDEGSIQYKSGGALGGDSLLKFDATNKWLILSQVVSLTLDTGVLVGGTITPSTSGVSGTTRLVTTDANFTIALPTGSNSPTGYEFYIRLVVINSGANVIKATYSAYTVLGYSGPPRKIAPGSRQEYWLMTRNAGTTWEIIGSSPIISQVSFWDPGVPPVSTTIFSQYIFNPTRVPFDPADIGTVTCTTAPSAATDFIVTRQVLGQSPINVARASFGAGNLWSTWTLWSTSSGTWVAPAASQVVELAHGEFLNVVTPASMNGLAGLRFFMACAEREDQS